MPDYKELIMVRNNVTHRKEDSSCHSAGAELGSHALHVESVSVEAVFLETLSSQDLAEPVACCDSNQERSTKYLNGELSLQDIKDITRHLKECRLCLSQRQAEAIVRRIIKRHCQRDQAPDDLKARIIVRIGALTDVERSL